MVAGYANGSRETFDCNVFEWDVTLPLNEVHTKAQSGDREGSQTPYLYSTVFGIGTAYLRVGP